ncbi:MAG: ribosome biogenesis GTPase [Limisphaerales bacterium]|jgi:ribosome biogenesis GTPase
MGEGIVTRSTGSWYEIIDKEGGIYSARLRGKFKQTIKNLSNPVAVGDEVVFEEDEEEGTVVINVIKPRRNHIIRRSPRNQHKKHIVASNIDQAFLLVTLANPRTSLGFIDRFLINCGTYHIPVSLLFNKSDLLTDKLTAKQDEVISLYDSLGYSSFVLSAHTGEGLQSVRDALKDKVTLLAGHSGVGKSSLANALEPGLGIRVKDISKQSGKGQHTTTYAAMLKLNIGGWMVDTPGIKEFGIVDLDREEVGHYFKEFVELLDHCKFSNCMHLNEPKCAVIEALQQGKIAESRYVSYLSMLDDIETAAPDWA